MQMLGDSQYMNFPDEVAVQSAVFTRKDVKE